MLNKFKKKIYHGLVIHYLLDRLRSVGIGFRPYYIVEEGCLPVEPGQLKSDFTNYETCFLTRDEIKQIAGHPECGHEECVFMNRLSAGCRCYGLKQNSRLTAYMWCNFNKIESYISIDMKPDSVYLFDAWTYKQYRGKNLAPVLREQLYAELRRMGYKHFYSVSDVFNTPALKFKKKLGARNIKLYLYWNITNRFRKNFLLRTIYQE